LISRKVLVSIILGVAGVLIMTWHMGRFPAHVVIINQSGMTLTRVTLDAGRTHFDLGTLGNAETRRFSVDPSPKVTLRFHTTADHEWNSTGPLTAAQSLVLYVTPEQRVEARDRIGNFSR
jgi:hypothetical protein